MLLVNNVPNRRHALLNENFSAKHRLSPYELLVSEELEAPQTTQATAMALDCSL